jgi:hypothetical protein
VGFDPEPALASQGRDPPRDDHWRPVKRWSKMDENFGLFSLNKHDFGLFWNDGEGFSGKNGFCHQVRRWDLKSLDFVLVDFLKITSVTSPSF